MKRHALWLALAVAAFIVAAGYLLRRKPAPRAPVPLPVAASRPASSSPYAPPPNQAAPPAPKPIVAIEDGKTLDFSSGAPILKDTAVEKAIIERAVHQINAAVQDVSFSSPTKAPDEKKAEPEKAPPK